MRGVLIEMRVRYAAWGAMVFEVARGEAMALRSGARHSAAVGLCRDALGAA